MPTSLANLSRNRGEFTHEFSDGTSITIVYRPGKITPRQMRRATELRERQEQGDSLTEAERMEMLEEQTRLLADALISWDGLDDAEGNPIPATYAGLQDVDYEAQSMILEWIVEDQQLGKQTESGTSPGSSTPDSELSEVARKIRSSHQPPTGISNGRRRAG